MPTEDFIEQPPSSTKIWRYMNFDKFASLLTTASLFFCQVKRFDDQNEGSMQMSGFENIEGSELEKQLTQIYDAPNGWRHYVAANCWHMNEYELYAMWKLYLENNQGIAIQSTVERLNQSLLNIASFGSYYAGAITYEKFQVYSITPGQGVEMVKIVLFRKKTGIFARKRISCDYLLSRFTANKSSRRHFCCSRPKQSDRKNLHCSRSTSLYSNRHPRSIG